MVQVEEGGIGMCFSSWCDHSYVLACRQCEMLKRKERNEAHLYFLVEVYLEEDFQVHQGTDLLDFDEVKPRLLLLVLYPYLHLGIFFLGGGGG